MSSPREQAEVIELHVPDMSCSACEQVIRFALQQRAGVLAVQADARTKTVRVEVTPAVPGENVKRWVEALGYTAELVERS